MAEETIKDPRDLNGDGKVTLDEKIKYAASKAGEKLSEVAGVPVPKAVSDLRDAPILHDIVCDRTQMKEEVRRFLGLSDEN